MFTGIIEKIGIVVDVIPSSSNVHLWIKSDIVKSSYIDQSIAHNGVCLTVVEIEEDRYKVTAVAETLQVSNLNSLQIGDTVNLERSMLPDTRLDGHFVQGHVDQVTTCLVIEDLSGSWYFTFALPKDKKHLVVNKGSIAINGTSLTVVLEEADDTILKVAIIPYTFEHTSFSRMKVGDKVNLEFDILGKYVARMMEAR